MKRTAFYRLPEDIKISIIVGLFISVLVSYIPNYDRLLYSQTESVEYILAQNYAGYPAGEDVPELVSREEILEERHAYTLVVDAESIKPLHLYLRLSVSDRTISESAFFRFWDKVANEETSGQFYSVVLESGDTMIVLLDDYAVKLPRSGMVRLPIGTTQNTGETLQRYLARKGDFSQDELAYYVDMASRWRSGKIAEKIEDVRFPIWMVTWMLVGFGTYYLFKKMERIESECANQ